MDDLINPWFAGARLAIFFGLSGACFTFGVAIVCRWMAWSPINITVNIDRYVDGPALPSNEQKSEASK